MKPQPINTLPRKPGFAFIGLILDEDVNGKPMWEIDHYQFVGVNEVKLMNCNSNNYTQALKVLTHWMPEPDFPEKN